MDGYGSSSGAGGGGFPIRSSGGGGGGGIMPSSERVSQPLAQYANTNGVVSRPRGGGGGEDGFVGGGGGGGGGGRAQQPSHEVFMVREASRGSLHASQSQEGRQSFATSGNRFQMESGGGGGESEQRQVLPVQQSNSSSSHSTGHHRDRSERDRDKERDHQQQKQFPLPKMLKIAVVGESTSGKTAICNAFTSEGYNFSRNYHMTTGVSIYAKSIKLPSARPGGGEERNHQQSSSGPEDSSSHLLETRINLVLVDSSGKPIYKELLPHYWDRLDGVALVLDLTSSTALESASDWLNLAKGSMISSQQNKKHVPPSDGSGDQTGNGSGGGGKRGGVGGSDQSFLGVLIGSKTDLKDQRVISPKAAQDFASQHGLQYFECSAKENSGMEEPFFYLAHQWTTSVGSPADKENSSLDGDVTGSGGIFAMGKGSSNSHSSGNTGGNSTSKRSAFGSRQGSSSEAF